MNKETMKIASWLNAELTRLDHAERIIDFIKRNASGMTGGTNREIKFTDFKRVVNMSIKTGQQWA